MTVYQPPGGAKKKKNPPKPGQMPGSGPRPQMPSGGKKQYTSSANPTGGGNAKALSGAEPITAPQLGPINPSGGKKRPSGEMQTSSRKIVSPSSLKKPKGPPLEKLAKAKSKAGRVARNALAAKTVLGAGAHRAQAAASAPGVSYSGKSYTRANVDDLAGELNRRGVTVRQYFTNNPGAARALGFSDKEVNQYVSMREGTSRARRLARLQRAKGRY